MSHSEAQIWWEQLVERTSRFLRSFEIPSQSGIRHVHLISFRVSCFSCIVTATNASLALVLRLKAVSVVNRAKYVDILTRHEPRNALPAQLVDTMLELERANGRSICLIDYSLH